jgi:hypothetical protein
MVANYRKGGGHHSEKKRRGCGPPAQSASTGGSGNSPDAQKEKLKVKLMKTKEMTPEMQKDIEALFVAKALNPGEEKLTMALEHYETPGSAAEAAVILQTAKVLAQAIYTQDDRQKENLNKLKRLEARINVAQDKDKIFIALAQFFPRLEKNTQKALNDIKEKWKVWDAQSIQKMFQLMLIFYRARNEGFNW